MNTDNLYKGTFVILIIIILAFVWNIHTNISEYSDSIDSLKQSIINSDSLVKEADGRYAKLVNYYNDESELKEQLKNSNLDLYKIIKRQEERILSLTTIVVTLKNEINKGTGVKDPADTNKIKFSLKYPNDISPFINWNGSIDRTSAFYSGEWSFGKLPINISLTEDTRGIWKSRIIGPSWLIVDSVNINSLPPAEYVDKEQKKIQFVLGANYLKSLANTKSNSVGIAAGMCLYNQHSILVHATTDKQIGVGYYYQFKSFKRKK
jgi:hypothetical protein